ncbi:hypothetical protein F5I97DRAFT_1817822, partial [Phlebopus sp. FC_14]
VTVVDISEVHFIDFCYCNCPSAPSPHLQLLEVNFFPSTIAISMTAFIFKALDDFLHDNVKCGTSMMNYYNKLHRITSNVFPGTVPVSASYWNLFHMQMILQNRYHDLLKVSRL